jgi:hypothetical protein
MRVRKILRDETKKGREECYNSMPKIEVNKHITRLLDGHDHDLSGAGSASEDWNPGIPQHVFPEWAQIMGAFYQPEPETLEDYPAESYLCHNGLGWLSGGSRRLVFEERDATGQAR